MDSVTKAMTIRIGTEGGDETLWTFKTLTDGVKDFAGKIKDFILDYGAWAERLREGGEYSEMTANFNSVAAAYGKDSEQILRYLDGVTEGQLNMVQLTQQATKAIQLGYSDGFMGEIFSRAKKLSDQYGSDIASNITGLEYAIATGKDRSLLAFGIIKKEGETTFEALKRSNDEFGKGAFNFADVEKTWQNMWFNFKTVAYGALNDVAGESGLAEFTDKVRSDSWDIFGTVVNVTKAIATPVKDLFVYTAKLSYDMLTYFADDINTGHNAFRTAASGITNIVFGVAGVTAEIFALVEKGIGKVISAAEWADEKQEMLGIGLDRIKARRDGIYKDFHEGAAAIEAVPLKIAEAELKVQMLMAQSSKVMVDHTGKIRDMGAAQAEATDKTDGGFRSLKAITDEHRAAAKEAEANAKEVEKWSDKVSECFKHAGEAAVKYNEKLEDIGINTKRKVADITAEYEKAKNLLWYSPEYGAETSTKMAALEKKYSEDIAKAQLDNARALEDAKRDYDRKKKEDAAKLAEDQAKLDHARLIQQGVTTDSRGSIVNQGGGAGSSGVGVSMNSTGGITINVPPGDKIGAAIRDWLLGDAMASDALRAGV